MALSEVVAELPKTEESLVETRIVGNAKEACTEPLERKIAVGTKNNLFEKTVPNSRFAETYKTKAMQP